jgi:LysM repeat protein
MEDGSREFYRSRRARDGKTERGGLTLKQLAFLIGANAVIALVISVAVTLTLGRRASPAPAVIPTATVASSGVSTPAAATPTTESASETVYVVKAGDSLSAIAFEYGLSVEELMAANGLTDPDVLFVGQKLTIPVPGSVVLPTPTAATAAPTAGSTPLPTNTKPTGPDLRIESVEAGADDAYMVITNWGTWVRLKDWTLDAGEGNVYTFPDLSLFQGGTVHLHTAAGSNTEIDLYWGVDKSLLASGTVLTLKDAAGGVAATYTVP